MIYWHIQMYKPSGRSPDGIKIDSVKMLRELPPVIGTGEWEDIQCRQFKDEVHDGLKIGDIILVRSGAQSLALCKIIGENFEDHELTKKYFHENFRKVKILEWYKGHEPFPQPQKTLQRLLNTGTDSWKYIDKLYKHYLINKQMQDNVDILRYKKQVILQGPPGTGKTYTAKDMAEELIFGHVHEDKKVQQKDLKDSGQYHIIQFHPAYAYEDFVRGITIKPAGSSVVYEAENKLLIRVAAKALENWNLHHATIEVSTREQWLDETIGNFKDYLVDMLDNEEEHIMITKKAYISRVTENAIRYDAEKWPIDGGVPDSDLRKMFLSDLKTRKEIMKLETLTKTAKSLPTYWLAMLSLFKKYISDNELVLPTNTQRPELMNYVLVIDEINRANLPAVLGELIYALEYRGEGIDSTYEYNGERELILPPNLYIIGTMNTADRSVGHIDYAIRRRFAFIDVPPSEQPIENVLSEPTKSLAKALFKKVALLFTEGNIAPDFKAADVQLGHSYFLAKTPEELELKLSYEIKPLLREYLKDGILLPGLNNGGVQSDTETYINELR
ncbi:MAG: ATPase [Chitinophagaceae bacterium]|nr:ATPase [Chitinophagaceae bacterium]